MACREIFGGVRRGRGLWRGTGRGMRKDVEREMRVGLDACRKGGRVYL